jgi:tripartite-type tricarboxylate transporter receptor subunit TctC
MNNEKMIRVPTKSAAWLWWGAVFFGMFFGKSSLAQPSDDYPKRPIRIIVSFAPGGGTDIIARALTIKLTDILKQSVFIENKVGASGNIGTQYVANAAPDGYTYLVTSSAYIVNYSFQKNQAGYDPIKDFSPVIIAASQPMAIVVNEKFAAKNIQELKNLAAKTSLSYSSAGAGTPPQITCDGLFNGVWKSDAVHIPYKGAAPALTALISGEVPIFCGTVGGVSQYVKQGLVRVLAISSEKRLASMPDIPTLSELGYPQLKNDVWQGMFAPAKTPKYMVEKMNQAMNQALKSEEIQEKFKGLDLVIVGGTTAQTTEYIQSELKRWDLISKNSSTLKID